MTKPPHPFDPEIDAAAYVSGAMPPAHRRAFEGHLLECEGCWDEVRADREGRRLAEMAREVAPGGLRDAVRASVAGSTGQRHSRTRLPRMIAMAAALLLAASLGTFLGQSRAGAEPRPIQAALDVYRAGEVSGGGIDHAPDLAHLGLTLIGSERMSLAGMRVEAFSYRGASGGSLSLFMANDPFPRAREASPGPSELPSAWEAERDGIAMLSSAQPPCYLVITSDHGLMDMFAGGLSSGQVAISA
jgi:anti-sigma factor RsiW